MESPGPVNLTHVRLANAVAMLVGLWLIVTRFVVWAPVEVIGPWNHGILGIAVALMAGYRLARPASSAAMSWMIAVLGVWLMASPFLFDYSLVTPILWSDVAAGLLLVLAGVWGGVAGGRRREV